MKILLCLLYTVKKENNNSNTHTQHINKLLLNRDNDTFILILQTMAFHILELRKVKFFVPVEALNNPYFLYHASGCLCF